jgi:hypothetical protein
LRLELLQAAEEQVLLSREVVERGRLGNLCGERDLGDCDPLEATLDE